MSKTFQALSHYNFRVWFFANLLAATGVWMQRVAQDWVVLTVLSDDSGVAVGIVTALQFGPVLFISPFAGVWADRFDRRKILIASQSLMALLALAIAALLLADVAQLWHIYALALIGGIVQAASTPARQVFVNEMVPPGEIPNAVSLNSLSFNIARMIGPALAGLAVAAVGAGWVFIVNMLLFVVPIIALALMRTGELYQRQRTPRQKGQIRAGFAYVRGRSDIVVLLIVVSTVCGLGMNFQLTSAVMARVEFGLGPDSYGLLGTCLAIGAVIGALISARLGRPRVRSVLIAAFAFGVIQAGLALAPSYQWFAILAVPLGIAQLMMIIGASSTIQITTEPKMIGRVMSVFTMLFLGTTPIGAPLIGWVCEAFSPRWGIAVGAIAPILVSLGCAAWAWRAWDVRLERHPLRVIGPRERAQSASQTPLN